MSTLLPSYIVYQAKELTELEKRVTLALTDGYVCAGGVAVAPGMWFFQAMVRTK